MNGRNLVIRLAILWATLIAPAALRAGDEIFSYALVRDDATLQVAGRVIRLHGIHIPETGQTCRHRQTPIRCASRAALALDSKIQGFVRCIPQVRYDDGTLSAICYDDDVDLGAYLVSQGWAVAGPDAPFDYTVRERIARHQGKGVWGRHVDEFRSIQ